MAITAEQRKVLLLIVILGVLGFGGSLWYWFVFGSASYKQSLEIKKKQDAEAKRYQDDLDKYRALVNRMQNSETGYEALKVTLEATEKRLPKTEEAFGFFDALNEILLRTGISNLRLEKEKAPAQAGYTEIPYSARAVGRYHEFGQFLDLVENNEDRFMRVKSLKMSNDPKIPTLHPIEVQIATYMLVETKHD